MAYCLDQAVGHFGVLVESELEQAGHKKDKTDRRLEQARKLVLEKYFGKEEERQQPQQQFADPAAFFS